MRSRAPRRSRSYLAAGRFDRAAIMRRAVGLARTLRILPTWQARMAVALRTVWGWAKREREAARPRRLDLNRAEPLALLAAAGVGWRKDWPR